MASSFENYNKRRLVSSYFSVVLSIFLVLFLLGALGIFVIHTKKITTYVKENIPMTVFVHDDANDSIVSALETDIKNASYVKSYVFIQKDSAAKQNLDIVGEDYMEYIGFNPLQNSFDLSIKGDYVAIDSLKKIETKFKTNPFVTDVLYDKNLVSLANDNIKNITYWMLVISAILAIIAMLLINSSLRLSVYSHRFTIKTMQMVGATKAFIRKPFIWRSIKLGIIGSTLAVIALIALIIYVDESFPKLKIASDSSSNAILILGVFVLGILITWLSTFLATQRFLNLRTEDLY